MRSVLELLGQQAAESERLGHPTTATIEALRAAGLFGFGVSTELGGTGDAASPIFECLLALAAADPASSWVVGTSAVSKTFAAMAFGPEGAVELVGPTEPACGSGHPRGRLRVTDRDSILDGRWSWISGCGSAAMAILGAGRPDEPGALVAAAVPMADLTIVPDWDVAGMRGTGSHTVVADNVGIAADRWSPVTFTAWFPAFSAVTVAAPVIGAAAGAVAFARQESAPDLTAQRQIDDAIGEARAVCSEIDSRAPDLSAEDMMGLRARLSHASRLALSALDPVLDLLGASTFRATHPVQRLWRDAHVGARHPLILPTP